MNDRDRASLGWHGHVPMPVSSADQHGHEYMPMPPQPRRPPTLGHRSYPCTMPQIDRKLVWVMAIACGIAVANNYYNQPLLADMGRTFGASARQMGFVVTLGQVGYAAGMLLFVPLGDLLERRRLIVLLMLIV